MMEPARAETAELRNVRRKRSLNPSVSAMKLVRGLRTCHFLIVSVSCGPEISLVVGGGKAEESNFEPWSLPEGKEEKEIWGVQSEGSAELTYIDLLRNPEGYTG